MTSSSNTKYDAVEWHVGGEYPEDMGPEGGRTHIGMYLAWLAENRLLSDELEARYPNELRQCRDHMMKGSQILEVCCDDVLVAEDMSEIGRAFSDYYYEEYYLDDYVETLDDEALPSIYHMIDDWDTYETLRPVLQDRFEQWQREQVLDDEDDAED